MHSDLIILSSPERDTICSPPPSAAITETGQQHHARAASSSPIPSPTELLFGAPLRSKFFVSLDRIRSKTGDGVTKPENTAPTEGTTQKKKEGEPGALELMVLSDSNPADVENEDKVPSKPKRTSRKRTNGSASGEKVKKNKTIVGKVGKPRAQKSKEPNAKPVECPSSSKQTRRGSAEKDEIGDLQLEPALERRLNWTPTKEQSIECTALKDEDKAKVETGQSKLGTLLSGYEYDEINTGPERFLAPNGEGPTKRRRIQLLESNLLPSKSPSNDSASGKEGSLPVGSKPNKKSRARSKRLNTLTARVTAPYLESADPTDREIFIAPERKKRKADANSMLRVPETIVLSPKTALKSLENQELVFGTCSQLEREDSPNLFRETQIALQESEKDFVSALSPRRADSRELTKVASTSCLTKAPKNLWAVAARDLDGSLKDVEVIELLDTPEAPKTINVMAEHIAKEYLQNKVHHARFDCERAAQKASTSNVSSCTQDLPTSFATTQTDGPVPIKPKVSLKPSMPNYTAYTDTELAKEIKSNGLKAIKSRKKMVEVLGKCWAAQHGRIHTEQDGDLHITATRYSAQISALAGPQKAEQKPRKPRTTSQNKKTQIKPKLSNSQVTRADEFDTGTAPSETGQPTWQPDPARTNKTNLTFTKKHTQFTPTKSFIDIEEIQDSEDEFLPSPSQLQIQIFGFPSEDKRELPTSAIPISPSPSRPSSRNKHNASYSSTITTTDTTTLATSALDDKTEEILFAELGDQISKAVRAQPRQNQNGPSSSRLSWHEKILMYDPIYLEDFTAWLNTEGLTLINEDREVGAGLVRRWCESKGICCCYKVKKKGARF
ncbi:hypothetical protein BJX64DRAFT_282579 [Aspergillus heterothallicus]